jgi:hypothetical protein
MIGQWLRFFHSIRIPRTDDIFAFRWPNRAFDFAMNDLNLDQYGPAIASLLSNAPVNELGPGKPLLPARSELDGLSPETMIAPHRIIDPTMTQACLAGLWLRFDFIDESHAISQDITTTTGSFWHGIMHRREPDYDNAKYWFHRVLEHPVFAPLCAVSKNVDVGTNSADPAASFLKTQSQWDPFRFIDLVAAVARGKSSSEQLCREIQRREWELLFDFCYRGAIGKQD